MQRDSLREPVCVCVQVAVHVWQPVCVCVRFWVDFTNHKEAALNSFGVVPAFVTLFGLI